MEKLKKLRTPVRAGFTKLTTEIEETLHDKIIEIENLQALLENFQEKQAELSILDQKILDIMSDDTTCKQDAIDSEYESIDQYKSRFF